MKTSLSKYEEHAHQNISSISSEESCNKKNYDALKISVILAANSTTIILPTCVTKLFE